MPRCGCGTACACSVVHGSPATNVAGNGSVGSPFTVSLVLDPSDSNIAQVTSDGLLVTPYGQLNTYAANSGMAPSSECALAEAPSADIFLDLPSVAATGVAGSVKTIKKVSAPHNVVIRAFGSETVDGNPSVTLTADGACLTLIASVDFGWLIIGMV